MMRFSFKINASTRGENNARDNSPAPPPPPANCHEEGQLTNAAIWQSYISSTFPRDEITFAFAYGSGVFEQQQPTSPPSTGSSTSTLLSRPNSNDKLVDLIFVVKDAYRFHSWNRLMNPDHYHSVPWHIQRRGSVMKPRGTAVNHEDNRHHDDPVARYVTEWQRQPVPRWWSALDGWCLPALANPGLYFHLTPTIKYGVIQHDEAVTDLRDWRYLYLAGRLHKPVLTLIEDGRDSSHAENGGDSHSPRQQRSPLMGSISYLQQYHNLPAAVAMSVLLSSSPPPCTTTAGAMTATVGTLALAESDLYQIIASLSYTGDVRMAVGAEDPHKVSKLVESVGQVSRFRRLYEPIVQPWREQGFLQITEATDGSRILAATAETPTQRLWQWDMGSAVARTTIWNALPFPFRNKVMRAHPNLFHSMSLPSSTSSPWPSASESPLPVALENASFLGRDRAVRPLLAESPSSSSLPATLSLSDALRQTLHHIVAPATRYQTIKGIVSAGVWPSLQYAVRKLAKGRRR